MHPHHAYGFKPGGMCTYVMCMGEALYSPCLTQTSWLWVNKKLLLQGVTWSGLTSQPEVVAMWPIP